MIDGHGDDLYRYGGKIKFNFSSNIYQGISHNSLKLHLSSCLDVISHYPEAAPRSVEALIAERLHLSPGNIMVTNGAADAIHIIATAFHSCHSSVLQPTFAEYADACKSARHLVNSFYDIDDIPCNTELVWICNPNNPTGKVISRYSLTALLDHNPEITFIVDQAYHKYTQHECLSPEEVVRHNNLVLIYSLTKDHAIPGLRLGYVVGDIDFIKWLGHFRAPWSVNALAIEGAKYLLGAPDIDINLDELLEETSRVSEIFQNMGIDVTPTDTNFMLCRLPNRRACDLKDFLVAEHGILIRDASNFEGLTEKHFRIAVQDRESNNILINAIRQWLQS